MTLFALVLGAVALLAMPGLAAAKDRNHDRIPDRWEKRHHLSLTVNQARHDQDGDHLRNRGEFLAGDNPRDRDSDDDGVMDGSEQAGTIASFDATTGRLVIDLFGTDTVAGFVTDETEIKCEDDSSSASVSSEGPGSGEAEPGDDNGGEGEIEPGDDNGGQAKSPAMTTAATTRATTQVPAATTPAPAMTATTTRAIASAPPRSWSPAQSSRRPS
jgi:hypothetical protein